MSDGITLSRERGVNPALVTCARCGEQTNEIALLGNAREYECLDCHGRFIGRTLRGIDGCPHCGSKTGRFEPLGEYDGSRGIPGLCDKCRAKDEEMHQAVKEGGVYWKCDDCGSSGALKKCDLADAVREELNIEPPLPCGVKFSKKGAPPCPVCGEKNDG